MREQGNIIEDEVVRDLLDMVDLGWLEMGVSPEGDTLWIPTQRGCEALEMDQPVSVR